MADNRSKTVEEQIKEADFVNNFKGRLGNEGEEMAREFIKMDDDKKLIIGFVIGVKSILHGDKDDCAILAMLLSLLQTKDKVTTNHFLSGMLYLFKKIAEKDFNE